MALESTTPNPRSTGPATAGGVSLARSGFATVARQPYAACLRGPVSSNDEFSTGVSLLPSEERFDLEVETLLLTKLAIAAEPIERVWSRVAFGLGIHHPNPHPSLAPDAVQIGFFDHMWDYPLSKMLDVFGDRMPPDTMLDRQAELLNMGNIERADELRSFQQAYRDLIRNELKPRSSSELPNP